MKQKMDWCLTHSSPLYTGQEVGTERWEGRCHWDVAAGPRPGRGPCKPVPATVEFEWPRPEEVTP